MNWKLPNQLTVARIVLAAVFFVLLGVYEQGSAHAQALLNVAFVLYIIAGITDVLDGYLARKWNVTSAFGRIVDPFVDKVLVVGTFVMLAGSNFTLRSIFLPAPAQNPELYDLPRWFTGGTATGVQAWMVVVILSREFVVSAVRGYSESQGVKFPAMSAGKLKMFIQSLAICVVLFQLANGPQAQWAVVLRLVLVWAAVVVTVISGFAYIGQARKVFREGA